MRFSSIDYHKIMQRTEVQSLWAKLVKEVARWLPQKHRLQRILEPSHHHRFKRSIWSSISIKTSRRHQSWSLDNLRQSLALQIWAALVEEDSAGPSHSVVVWVEVVFTTDQDVATIRCAFHRTPHTLTQLLEGAVHQTKDRAALSYLLIRQKTTRF